MAAIASEKKAILKRSEIHTFTEEDFAKIRSSLKRLYPLGNKKAWSYLKEVFAGDQLERRLLGDLGIPALDALNDFDAEPAARTAKTGYVYVRDQTLPERVLDRANGICEYCGRESFMQEDGSKYLEAHHVIHLKNQGPDSFTNLIALCANDHREVHFGALKRQRQMDTQMQETIAKLISRKTSKSVMPASPHKRAFGKLRLPETRNSPAIKIKAKY